MTPTLRHRSLLAAMCACALGAGLGLRLAHAETLMGVTSQAEAKANYQHDLEACRNHTVDEDMKTCRLEAQRAYGEARREASMHGGKSQTRHAKARTQGTATSTSGTSADTSANGASTGTDAAVPKSPNK